MLLFQRLVFFFLHSRFLFSKNGGLRIINNFQKKTSENRSDVFIFLDGLKVMGLGAVRVVEMFGVMSSTDLV